MGIVFCIDATLVPYRRKKHSPRAEPFRPANGEREIVSSFLEAKKNPRTRTSTILERKGTRAERKRALEFDAER
jgi:hypothetical protein